MRKSPLAVRMRPYHINDIIGQEHLIGKGKIIRRMVESNNIASMILFGPPGTGKTSMAYAIAKSLQLPTRQLNAVVDKKKDMEIVVEEAKMHGQMILILDEVHRLDKAKQDFLLPHLESNIITMIGCTTSNPYHSINPAIRSRVHLFELHSLEIDQVKHMIEKTLNDKDNGYGKLNVTIEENALEHFANSAGGDLRTLLNGLELAISSTPPNEATGEIRITLDISEQCMQRKSFSHDKGGDAHYDVLSAFQKSIRGSDVNAALHYLGRLIEAEDLESIARRLIVIAYEDIGLANPQAGPRALAAVEAAERLGFPEARIPLSVSVVELALSPKSNSAYKALDAALQDVRTNAGEVPIHLKDSHYYGASKLGRGVEYKYPFNHDGNWVNQQYLPDTLKHKQYFKAYSNSKFEQAMKQVYENILKNTR